MNRTMLRVVAAAALLAGLMMIGGRGAHAAPQPPKDYTLAVYLWPCYHPDPFHDKRLGPGWTEWELVKKAKPKYPGQVQPRKPLWGYRDESDPKEMARSIDAMADAGIDAIIFDWYRYEDNENGGRMLEDALARGFLGAPNNGRLKFALMWANHEYINLYPFPPGVTFGHPKREVWRNSLVTRAAFERHTGDAIEYFKRPNYWKIDGRPYFSIYELHTLMKGLGGPEPTREALADFRKRTEAAGLPGLHLNVSYYSLRSAFALCKGQTVGGRKIETENDMLAAFGIDSTNPYVWVHLTSPAEYPLWMERSMKTWDEVCAKLNIPCYPNVSVGWDGTPRNYQGGIVTGNTPERFEEALRRARAWLDQHPREQRILTINAWNEWAEGSNLEPDTIHGTKYLEAIKKVFGSGAAK